ncbi:MAG: helix-turn-helix domain-containing protein [Candidatus Eremiobacteraeota bacterium]|nr:helix-turn-helix domain-containing protein [Candidatus Eremiobacteraeota bacterium]
MPGLGDEFRAAREARHLSLSDVSEQIHIRSIYLQSIEADEWSTLPAPVYVRGFLRTYARFLGLDPEAAVERLNVELGDAGARPHEPVAVKPVRTRSAARSSPSPWFWIAAAVAVILLGLVGYKTYEYQQSGGGAQTAVADASPSADPAAPSAAPSNAIVPLPVATAKPKPPAHTLVVSITQKSWLLVKVDGAQIVEGIYPPGTVKKFHGKSASIRAGNAGGVELTVKGKRLGALGKLGSVVDKTVQLAEE